ncbi:crossover junction endodeoxyribonuclease RuvC [Flectobacillus major]|jgi:crossover junction endodeoxyribonuclease RuvC|uniref:crossover junction endodeoxyribonuclease RuvC n=1 Tax=Flectobacillus major TaxID=103 RepID=UPI0004059985|nr:crossover junction endodeoxyribonuclease RuvC [Flectobacillus major]
MAEILEKIILGVDPGTRFMGYGVILVQRGNISVLQYGVINVSKYTTQELKLKKIYERIIGIIEEFTPDEMAIEAPFFGKNVQSMLKLGRAQGVVMAAALSRQIPIVEYSPKTVKQSVTGNGNASKEQVASMLDHLLKMKLEPTMFDATDALGIAVCHHFHGNNIMPTNKGTKKGWGAFVNENPERIK